MPTASDPAAPARDVFPEYRTLPGLFADEMRGLGDDVEDRRLKDQMGNIG